MITIRTMRTAGMSADQIVRLLETAENEKLLHRREQNRINKKKQRARHQKRDDMKNSEQNQQPGHQVSDDMMTSAYIEKSLSSSSESQSKKRKKVYIPENWSPNERGLSLAKQLSWSEHKIKSEIHRFRDYALAHNRQQADWQAAWRNWVTSPFQKQERKSGAGNQLMEALDRAIDRAGSEDFGRPNPIRDITPRRADPGQAPPALLAPRKPT